MAIKLFKLDLPPERAHQLVSELEHLIAADLSHPGLAAPIAAGMTGAGAFLATDYVAADSLDLAIRENGPMSTGSALKLATALAGALDSGASANVAHGTLHLRDVLLSGADTRLTGIGVAPALESVGVTAPVRRPYTAPERMAGLPWDRRADVFSLAALLHELLWVRRVTAIGDQAAEALTELAGADLAALKRVFARALAEDPTTRFPTSLEFVEAVKEAFHGIVAGAPADAKRRSRRREAGPLLPLDELELRPASRMSPELDIDAADLGVAERSRYTDVGTAPALVSLSSVDDAAAGRDPVIRPLSPRASSSTELVEPPNHEPVIGPPAGLIIGREPDGVAALDPARSAVWPLALAMMIGIALGFAAGYGVGTRDRPIPGAAGPPSSSVVAGREFTEGTVAEAPKPALSSQEQVPVKPDATRGMMPRPDANVRRPPANARPSSDSGRPHAPAVAGREPARRSPAVARAEGGGNGALVVDSRPAGAKVFLDGKAIGTTPLSIATVRVGNHAIRLERDGYRRWSSSVRVSASERKRVTASLGR